LLKLLHRWRTEAGQAGRPIKRMVVAYEAGRDGFWLARWLRARDVEAYVMHPTSIAVSREHRRAKTDRLDTELLMRAFLGWLRGEKRHCSMVAIPTIEEGGRTEAEPRAAESCHRANADREPNQGHLRAFRHSHLPADPAQGRGKTQRPAYRVRVSVAGEYVGGAVPPSRAVARRARADPCGRARTPAQARGSFRRGERLDRNGSTHCTSSWG